MAEHTRQDRPGARAVPWRQACCLSLALLCAVGGGCTRRFFRTAADKEVDAVLAEKDKVEAWKIEQYGVYPDPRARFADPTNPDRPPMPPDDPTAHDLAPNPQRPGKAGIDTIESTGYLDLIRQWDAENRSQESGVRSQESGARGQEPVAKGASPYAQKVDPPAASVPPSEPAIPGTAKRPFLLKVEQAVELGLINSREYQDRREDLYLTALPVTLQRFSFAAQFFATEQAIRERTGRQTPEGQHNRFRFNSNAGFSKLFSTGALLLFRFANQTVVELTGKFPRHTVSTSTVSLDLTQPFLQGGGKAVTLEPLTQSERTLVYGIRDYARFRKQYYVAVAGGGDIFRGGGGVGFSISPSGSAATEGYLPALLRSAQLRNEQENVVALEEILRRYQALAESGDYTQLQVDQVEQQLLGGRSTVLQREADYRDSLDRFKLQLGVPVNLPLELDNGPLNPLTRQLDNFEDVTSQFNQARNEALKLDAPGKAAEVRGVFRQLFTESAIARGTRFRAELPERWAEWQKMTADQLVERLKVLGEERRLLLDRKVSLEQRGRALSEDEERRLAGLEAALDLGRLEGGLRAYEEQPWQRQADEERKVRLRAIMFRDLLTGFELVLGGARRERLDQVRGNWPKLPPLCVAEVDLLKADLEKAQDTVAQTALANRFDLMNARAQLVDTWRQIAVRANALQGVLDVQYHGDASTPPGQAKPLAFNGNRMRNQLIVNGELPLVRKLERNNYRAALIAYQRERRSLMETEDVIVQQVRTQLRALRVLAENYAIQKRSVELAYLQVEQALDTINQPPTPSGAGSAPGAGSGAGNAAALTQQLLNAQGTLPRNQNQLYTTWINYLTTRMTLYRDLELLPLDLRGVWIDESATCQCGPAGRDGAADPGSRPAAGERPGGGEGGQPAAPLPPPAGARSGPGG